MRFNFLKANLKKTALATGVLLLGAVMPGARAQVNLTAAATSATLPDGSSVPMWGYTCGAAGAAGSGTCAALNPAAAGAWSPVVITIPTGTTLTINLTNSLPVPPGATTGIPTSIMIVGQVGGGLGDVTQRTTTASPDHSSAQSNVTWPIAGAAGNPGTPPVQGPRVQSFSTEVATGATKALTWSSLRPGTYLLESGTHPSIQGSMGLYGVVVVTTAPSGATAGTAYPAAGTQAAVTYNAEIPLLLSEVDPVQNRAVSTAVSKTGFSETLVWSGLPGGCGNPSSPTYQTCYPPVVDYTPLYYLINGAAFNKTSASTSLFPVSPATGVTGNVLVRLVNAGLKMHVPSIVGAQTGTGTPAKSGFSLIAEDGNPLPGLPRVQNEVFMAAGKTYDVMINAPATVGSGLPVYDRELSLSGNAVGRDSGMLAYISINGAGMPASPAIAPAIARADVYNAVVTGQTLTVSDPGKGLIANDTNVYGVQLIGTVAGLSLNPDGTFTYTGPPTSFSYCANGSVTGATCSSGITASVTLGAATIEGAGGIIVNPITYTSNLSTFIKVVPSGVLSVDKDTLGYALMVDTTSVVPASGLAVTMDPNGGFVATTSGAGTYTFTYKAKNSQGTVSASAATVTLIFQSPSNLAVTVLDGNDKKTTITDYRWIIEEDRTFYVNPNCTTNPPPAGCSTAGGIVPTFGTNFHTSFMPVVATGCTGTLSCESGQTLLGSPAVCDIGNGVCRTTAAQNTPVLPSSVHLDPTKRYYISVLPGDAATPFETANATPGHGMGGAPIGIDPTTHIQQSAVTVYAQPTPFPPAKLSVFVFEDDFPLNGEQDGGGGVDVLSPNEPGLGHFNITIMDDAGGSGDATGQVDYDMFNQPLSNSLSGTLDPASGQDACPISKEARIGVSDPNQTGITGTIVTCPKFEADGVTLSPLAGQAVVANMMPGRYGVVATPGADRIGAGEEWLQTNTLDGQKAHDSFLRIGEAGYFQEYGPAGYHVSIGFANPKIINGRKAGICAGTDPNAPNYPNGVSCTNSVTGVVTTERMSRTPDERLYSSGDNSSFSFTQCFVSFGDPDGEDFAFTKCAADGSFTLTGLPDGDWRITVFDQWNDMLVDGLSTPVRLAGGATANLGQLAINQWQANFNTRTFFDQNGDGISQAAEPGLALVKTNVRYRDGSFSNRNNTDLNGYAAFNEEFPLFNWYVVETDVTRYKNTGTHVVYDAGGPADGTPCGSSVTPPAAPCGSSAIGKFKANTFEQVSVPTNLRVPGAVYCADADCSTHPTGILGGPASSDPPSSCTTSATTGAVTCTTALSTARIDPPWVLTEGWQGFSGQNNFLEFGKKPYASGENGGIRGHVIYASTRPFDDPQFNTQNTWEPLVPGVTINLYKEGTAADGITPTLTLVDTTKTSSFDDWAQGFRSDGIPNMNCPGQSTTDLFYFTLYNQPNFLDVYNNGGTPAHTLPNNSQFKCYDGMHNWNQLQPAPYDGMYQFPSVLSLNPTTGAPVGTNCTACIANPDTTDPYRSGTPMLPDGKYVVEVVVPPGYEVVKEEDKNILIGDNFIAPVTVQFPGLGSAIYILPDQAEILNAINATSSAQNPTGSLGRIQGLESHEGDTSTADTFWPCVGATRVVPDYISLFPKSGEVAPFAGATRNLCDRKEVTLADQTSSQSDFFVWTETHAASHYAGVITDDFTSEFDPFSPQFGEKFAPPNLPISIKDWTGTEVSRVYADQWGTYNGLTYSTWEVNPPNPTGYSPTMMVTCMNDPGTGTTPDPLYNPQYSNFCYEIPFMPGQTQYMDTPVTPTSAFASSGYNNPDCAYPALTPAVKEVDGDGIGPWVSAAGKTLTITALGDQVIPNNAYSGPQATTAPFNQKTVTRHYGFGATRGTVTIAGTSATITGWNDTTITVTVPNIPAANSSCQIQQQTQYGGSAARCGQLVITAANGQQSIDSVTVTVGGKTPTHVTPLSSPTASTPGAIQTAIDAAQPGDLIIVNPGVYKEMLLMWKPVRLQGAGAATSIINGDAHPEGKLDPWRRQVNCLFGLALAGTPISATNKYDSTGTFTCSANMQFAVDRLPLEAVVGWDATLNGNLAELLQEPTLMGAYEGAAITVLAKGVNFHGGAPYAADTFPTGTTLLTNSTAALSSTAGSNGCGPNTATAHNPFPSNFWCNPSSIDGLGITNSSQGGGGIFVHAWGHNLQIANNRVYNNSGTLSGGITVGQGEFPPGYFVGGATNADPGSCVTTGLPAGYQEPYCHNLNVNVHNNEVVSNISIGDELFSSTLAGVGGVSFCTGSDYYKFNYNWVCGNIGTGDGGGIGQIGFSFQGDIEHNSILFNQSTNPTISTNGGGLLIMGSPDVDPTCGQLTDLDCAPPGLSDGTGPGLLINANLVMGNAADSGSGGGIRLQGVNGTDIVNFPKTPSQWYTATLTNNIITNNVAGWDGAGVSLVDSLAVNFINNTVISNDSTASAGPLFNTLGAPLAGSPNCLPPQCQQTTSTTTSAPQPAGFVVLNNSAALQGAFAASLVAPGTGWTCPAGHYSGTSATKANCSLLSYPVIANDVFWQNRTFYIGVGALGSGTINQQNVVKLYNSFLGTPAPSEPTTDATTANGSGSIITGGTGACVPGTSFWDIGVRGDTGPGNHNGGATLAPSYSVITDAADYSAAALHNTGSNPQVKSQYCNGSRTPPEYQSMGYQVPAGISDATVPNPVFSLTPAATVDEGNNWVNMAWGPLAMTNPVTNTTLGNYAPAAGSPVINYIPASATANYGEAPSLDFFGNTRKDGHVDAGAVEFQGTAAAAIASVTPTSLAFGTVPSTTTSAAQNLTLHNTGTATLTGIGITFTGQFSRATGAAAGTCGTTLAAASTCTIGVVFSPTSTGAKTGTAAIAASVTVTGSPVSLTGTGGAAPGALSFALTGTNPTGVSVGTFTVLGVTVPSLNFGLQTGTPKVAHVSVTNTGGSPVIFSSATFTNILNTNFTQTNNCPIGGAGLAVGASCTLNVTFTPPTTLTGVTRISDYTFTDNGTGSPQIFGVTGR